MVEDRTDEVLLAFLTMESLCDVNRDVSTSIYTASLHQSMRSIVARRCLLHLGSLLLVHFGSKCTNRSNMHHLKAASQGENFTKSELP